MSAQILTLPSFAKINLSLRVLGRRADGYHEIQTVFQTVSLHDRLTFTVLPDGQFALACDVAGIPVDEMNLIWRAAAALREWFGVRTGTRIDLQKRIPAGGGLGGGSSNAATTLLGLSCLWGIETSRDELAEIGARLGADVPFFLTGGRAVGTGRGTEIQPLPDNADFRLLIVTPPITVATAEAYAALDAPALTKAGSVGNLPISRESLNFSDSLCERLSNDFEPVVFQLYPEIERARDALLSAGARGALLSGSGASVFGIFDSREDSEQAHAALRAEATGWQVFPCTTLSRAKYVAAFGACAQL
ncbi:MAG: 4-(cytidine 5'-diphospho)-2-C-methyl-D-erythritol kinase [Pyrinomonadaceae bacterium]